MTEAEKLFHQISSTIDEITPGKMFGALCIKTPNKKAAAMYWKDFLVVKVNGEPWKEAMALDGTQLFDPMDGRPMKEWVQIPYSYNEKWDYFMRKAVEQVKLL